MLEIVEEDSYEKDALFYVELGDPQLQGGKNNNNKSPCLLSYPLFSFFPPLTEIQLLIYIYILVVS